MVHHNSEQSLVVEVKLKEHHYQKFLEFNESILGMITHSP